MFFKILVVALSLATAYSRVLQVRNSGSASLSVSVTDQDDVTLLPGGTVLVTVADDFSGSISAVAVGSDSNIPRTKVDLTLGATQDSYSVSLVEGFNVKAKIIPVQGTNCTTAVCSADLISKCPVANQVVNALGNVVACTNSPLIFRTVCPRAVVTVDDIANVHTCQAQSYLILVG